MKFVIFRHQLILFGQGTDSIFYVVSSILTLGLCWLALFVIKEFVRGEKRMEKNKQIKNEKSLML